MNISKKAIVTTIFFILSVFELSAQGKMTRDEYVDKYKWIAIDHMERYGIPASITMAQGILESGNGNSWLSQKSNNHFGIKCKSSWRGKTVRHDDDEKNECFRAYPNVEDSYSDHAEFLDSQPRYDSLFNYSSNDYKSWARGLKAAGYATAPNYASYLVKIIEDNKLYLLDRDNGGELYANRHNLKSADDAQFTDGSSVVVSETTTEVNPDNFRVTINAHMGYSVYMINSVNYVIAKRGDSFENIGAKFKISPRNLRKFNDLDKRDQPVEGEVVYIEKKPKRWVVGNKDKVHIAREGETSFAVAQSYGIRKRSIEKMNKLKKRSIIQKGTKLKLQ